MTKSDWPSIKRDYVETAMTLAEIEAKWDIARGTLSARATRERWRDQKKQFAAKLAQIRQEIILAKTAEEQAIFQSDISKVAKAQLGLIARQMREPSIDTAKLLKLTNALANVQRIGITAHGIGTGRVVAAPDDAANP